jgi:DNA-binding transcriptional LysR family regulator
MQDLNDLRFLRRGGRAERLCRRRPQARKPRSRLSRRIGLLEERLGVRLIHRSTRRFAVTEIGREYYRHCVAMMVEADAAQQVIERMRSEPQGVVRMSCPPSVIYFQVGEMIAHFMAQCPKIEVLLQSTNRPVDVIREGFDLAIACASHRLKKAISSSANSVTVSSGWSQARLR